MTGGLTQNAVVVTTLVILLLGFILIIIAIDRLSGSSARLRRQQQDLEKSWEELAGIIGLTYEAGRPGKISFYDALPRIWGKYHGFNIRMELLLTVTGGDFPTSHISTSTSIQLNSAGSLLFELREKEMLRTVFKRGVFLSGDEIFDGVYSATGSPPAFVQHALRLIVPRASLLFPLPDDVIFVSGIWKRPAIKLDESNLVCLQHGAPTDVMNQKEFIDLLCNLAELAEGVENG